MPANISAIADESPLPAQLRVSLDELRRRRGSKWSRYGNDVLPAFVADMDFPVAPVVRDALHDAIERSDLGYPPPMPYRPLQESFAAWAKRRWGWAFAADDVRIGPDVVHLLRYAVETFSAPGDGVVVQTPIYPPFLSVVSDTGRRLCENPLVPPVSDAGYRMDLDGLRRHLDDGARLVMLCNPHNPTGRAFTRAELEGVAEIVLAASGVQVICDEIHADLVLGGVHTPFASISEAVAARTITLNAASKAFNVAGLRCAVLVATGSALARVDEHVHFARGIGALGLEASLAAWSSEGEQWLQVLAEQLRRNRDRLATLVQRHLPGVRFHPPEATYLAWLDCRALGMGDPWTFFLEQARVALSNGPDFGEPGQGFVRLNFATAPTILDAIVERMAGAVRHSGS